MTLNRPDGWELCDWNNTINKEVKAELPFQVQVSVKLLNIATFGDYDFTISFTKIAGLDDQPDLQLVSGHNFILLRHEFRKIPCDIDIPACKPVPFLRR